MNLTANDLLMIIGEQQVELKILRLQVEALQKKVEELTPKAEIEQPV